MIVPAMGPPMTPASADADMNERERLGAALASGTNT